MSNTKYLGDLEFVVICTLEHLLFYHIKEQDVINLSQDHLKILWQTFELLHL